MIKILGQIILSVWGIMPGNYSAITHVHDNVYAVVDDKDEVDGFKRLTLDIDSVNGKVRKAVMTEPVGMAERRSAGTGKYRDCEGAAYFPEANTVFVSGEEDQRILEYSMDGYPTGRELDIPDYFKRDKIEQNYGFEALTYNERHGLFWTTTESTLLSDGERASAKNPNVVNRLRILSFGKDLKPKDLYFYEMDIPRARTAKAWNIIGVPSMLALDDGRLLVMERDACVKNHRYGSWANIKIYIVNPKEIKPGNTLNKRLLCKFTTHLKLGKMNFSNYEGMCLGPSLKDGSQTLILISDSQKGMGNRFYHLKDHVRVIRVKGYEL